MLERFSNVIEHIEPTSQEHAVDPDFLHKVVLTMGPNLLTFCLTSIIQLGTTTCQTHSVRAVRLDGSVLLLYPYTQGEGLVIWNHFIRKRPLFFCFMPFYVVGKHTHSLPIILRWPRLLKIHIPEPCNKLIFLKVNKIKSLSLFHIISLANWVCLFYTLHLHLS